MKTLFIAALVSAASVISTGLPALAQSNLSNEDLYLEVITRNLADYQVPYISPAQLLQEGYQLCAKKAEGYDIRRLTLNAMQAARYLPGESEETRMNLRNAAMIIGAGSNTLLCP